MQEGGTGGTFVTEQEKINQFDLPRDFSSTCD
jgi:hypothetical protein